MNTTNVNERALTEALDYLVGPGVRMAVENLYRILDNAEVRGELEGMQRGFTAGSDISRAFIESERHSAFSEGYDAGNRSATSTEQPMSDGEIYSRTSEKISGGVHVSDVAFWPNASELDCNALPPMQTQISRDPFPTAQHDADLIS